MEADRLNSPSTSVITFEVLGHQLHFYQDPNSKHLGTTVWDTSMVFAKFLEKNCRKGRFCPSKLKGKRVIELGAGCGVAGFGMACLGCDVVSTDQIEVVPLLRRNVERNSSRIMQMNSNSDSFGSIKVAELDWGNEDHIKAVAPPFDYVIGTDVVYAEHLVEPLLQTIIALSSPKTTIMLGHEIRSTSVHEQMLQTWKIFFDVKIVPKAKMDSKYQHPSIQLFIMGQKSSAVTAEKAEPAIRSEKLEKTAQDIEPQVNEVEPSKTDQDKEKNRGSSSLVDDLPLTRLPDEKLSEWEARRYGSMAASLLCDVKIT
ncbi:protein-lysine methyltransferase METTL21D-like [Hibiscus syriacus]|uniref:protein-lysine methyltransferase METTL21D-like n=1 Tax=Hibiscus syriacus TaxID=106335 RepID=UPI0019250AD0|nr:protein-lysine methyltransferase METTL21D-like [Hibiscus syriacus]